MTEFRCNNCHTPYPVQGVPYRCPVCTGLFDIQRLEFDPGLVDASRPGLWRYRHTFKLPPEAPIVNLGEGITPLEWRKIGGENVAFKLEYNNPSGSFKDRGSAVLISFLLSRGVRSVVEDSSGNAGASLAAYAAGFGLHARIYVPESASGPKLRQIESYDAQLVSIPGPRSQASLAVLQAAEHGETYASHAYLPFGLPGYATIAYELYDQIGQAPGAVICPAGQGNLLLGIGRGFQALLDSGLIKKLPVLVGVQTLACAPLWAVFRYGAQGLSWVSEGETLAEGVRVRTPLRGDALLQLIAQSGGLLHAVDEQAIRPGRDQLKQKGFYVEFTSAIVWDTLMHQLGNLPQPVVVVLTGAGFKSP